jgi:hypothetical protein
MSGERETRRIQLNYPLSRVKEPILYHLVTDYGLIPNIRRANIDVHAGGFIALELTGEPDALDRGLKFLEECGITVTSVGVEGAEEWST